MRHARSRRLRLLVVAPAIWMACHEPEQEAGPERPRTPDRAGGGAANGSDDPCSFPEQDRAATPTAQSVAELLVGEWRSCGGSVFATDEAGLSFDDAGEWAKLHAAPDGTLTPDSANERGRWTTIDTSAVNGAGSFQLNLTSLADGYVVHSMPVFATWPAKLRLDDIGERRTDYVRLSPYERTPDAAYPASSEPHVLPDAESFAELRAACGTLPADAGPAPTTDTLPQAALGIWVACDSRSVFDTDEVGLELSDDGRFYKLYVGAGGGLERGAGFDETGVWELVESDLGPGVERYLELHVFGARTVSVHPELLAQPAGMRLTFQGAARVLYIRAEP